MTEPNSQEQRLCKCHEKPYEDFTPLELKFGCYDCGGRPNKLTNPPSNQT